MSVAKLTDRQRRAYRVLASEIAPVPPMTVAVKCGWSREDACHELRGLGGHGFARETPSGCWTLTSVGVVSLPFHHLSLGMAAGPPDPTPAEVYGQALSYFRRNPTHHNRARLLAAGAARVEYICTHNPTECDTP